MTTQHISGVEVCTPVVQGYVLREVCRRSRVRDLFALFLNAYKTYCTRMYSYVLVYTTLYIHDIFIIQFMLVQTSMYWYILVCTSTYQYILLMPCHCSVCTGTYSFVPVQTDTFFILPVGNRRCHDMVQGSTCSNTPYHGKA